MKAQKLVQGVGFNDAEYQVCKFSKIDGKRRQVWTCPVYKTWRAMIERCYSKKHHERKPTYEECRVCVGWHRFSDFSKWMLTQDWEGKVLDKDIIIAGNKIYSPETCAFISRELNNFLTDRSALRGSWPIGVSWHPQGNKFRSHCRNPSDGTCEHLGMFSCPNKAHEAWRARKHQHACVYASLQSDHRVAEALRVRFL